MFIHTAQTKALAYSFKEIYNARLDTFMLPADYIGVKAKINKVFLTGKSEYVTYTLKNYNFLALLDKIDKNKIAVHETMDDPVHRTELKRLLWIASGNYHRILYKKRIG